MVRIVRRPEPDHHADRIAFVKVILFGDKALPPLGNAERAKDVARGRRRFTPILRPEQGLDYRHDKQIRKLAPASEGLYHT